MNGAAVTLATNPPAAPEAAAPTVERRIGEAAAAAAVAVAAAMSEFDDTGKLSVGSKLTGGRALAKVAELRLDFVGEDFDRIAREEGLKALELRHGAFCTSGQTR
jgi:hypothetical protein